MLTRRDAVKRMAGLFAVAVLPREWAHTGRRKPLPHPEPRVGITAEHVLAEDALPDKKSVRRAFQAARDYPELFDGIYCPCECSESMKHRSLLSCFESTQPVGCYSCKEVGELVGVEAKAGKTLDQIRVRVDSKFG